MLKVTDAKGKISLFPNTDKIIAVCYTPKGSKERTSVDEETRLPITQKVPVEQRAEIWFAGYNGSYELIGQEADDFMKLFEQEKQP